MLRQHNLIPGVRKIAVLRANAIGDFIFALPALDALRTAYPQAEIVLLGQRWHADFLSGRPGPIDRVVVIPPSRGVNGSETQTEDPDELEHFFAVMRHERFDLALQLHGGGRHSNPFVLGLGARTTVGLKTPDAPPLDRWLPYIYFQSEIIRYLEVVALTGAAPITLEPRIRVTEADLAEARRMLPDKGRPLVAIHPGAGDPKRRWPPEKFAAVADMLAEAGAQVVVIGARDEREVDQAVVDAMRADAHNLWNRLSLGGLAGLMSRCAVVISNDSGPLHLASAAGAATVGIYWCFNLVNSSELTRGRHRPVTSWELECPECGHNSLRGRCEHTCSFVANIPVEEVAAAALDLFEAEATGKASAQALHSAGRAG